MAWTNLDDAGKHAHTHNKNCNTYISLTASGLDKKGLTKKLNKLSAGGGGLIAFKPYYMYLLKIWNTLLFHAFL